MIKNKTGVWGELYAARYLRDRKYTIIYSNYVCRLGEIDIVARTGDTLCFVEVKTRDENTRTAAVEAVDYTKQQRIKAAAENFFAYTKMECRSRFDVCEVYLDKNYKPVRINYIEDAFQEVIK